MTSNTIFSNIPQEVLDILNNDQKAHLFDVFVAQSKEPAPHVKTEVETPLTFDAPIPKRRGKDKIKRTRRSNGRNLPIYEMVQFEKLARPRVYDKRTHMWKLKNQTVKNGENGFYLPFDSLVVMINEYHKGTHAKAIFEMIDTKLDTWSGLQTYIYYYRAGALNDGIYENAISFGYNPQELVSRECERIGGK